METLSKPWGPHAVGTQITKDPASVREGVVLVNARRLHALREGGFLAAPPAEPAEGGS